VVTFGDAHWAELIRPQRWAGVRACPPRRQGKAGQGGGSPQLQVSKKGTSPLKDVILPLLAVLV